MQTILVASRQKPNHVLLIPQNFKKKIGCLHNDQLSRKNDMVGVLFLMIFIILTKCEYPKSYFYLMPSHDAEPGDALF